MSKNKESHKEKVVIENKSSEVNEPKEVSKNKEVLSVEEQERIAVEKALKAAKRKENIGKFFKAIGRFLWKTINIKVIFLIILASLIFALGFYAGEENYKRVLRNESEQAIEDYNKAIEEFSDDWRKAWKDAFDK